MTSTSAAGKERPFKSYRSPADRPFKTYSPGLSVGGSVLFQDKYIPQFAGKMQQQQNSQSSHSLSQQRPGMQQVYGDPEDFTRLTPNHAQAAAMLAMEPSLNPYSYDDLGLGDTDNPLLDPTRLPRPDMLVANESLLQQREQDLNIPTASSLSGVAGSLSSMFNRNMMRGAATASALAGSLGSGLTSDPSLSMLFDSSSSPIPSALQQHLPSQNNSSSAKNNNSGSSMSAPGRNGLNGLNSSASSNALGGGGYSANAMSLASAGLATSSSSAANKRNSDPLMGEFPVIVKKEHHDDSSNSGEFPPDSISPSSINSPSTMSDTSSVGHHSSSGSSAPRQNGHHVAGVKRSISEVTADDRPSTSGANGNGQHASSTTTSPGNNNGSTHHHQSPPSGNNSTPAGSKPSPAKNGLTDQKNFDPAYLEKRRKNNESAKRSREARRSKEEMVALRVVTLEEENMKLRAESSLLEKELDELRHRLFNWKPSPQPASSPSSSLASQHHPTAATATPNDFVHKKLGAIHFPEADASAATGASSAPKEASSSRNKQQRPFKKYQPPVGRAGRPVMPSDLEEQ